VRVCLSKEFCLLKWCALFELSQAEVTQRLSRAKEAASRPVTPQSHEDLAKKLQVIDDVARSFGCLSTHFFLLCLWQNFFIFVFTRFKPSRRSANSV